MQYGFKPANAPGSYEGTGELAGRASISKLVGKRGATRGFVLTVDGVEYPLGKKASFNRVDEIISSLVK